MSVGPALSFRIHARDADARSGSLETPHGEIATPAFMPVATLGAVRGVAPGELRALGAEVLLANTYHLHERPGEAVIAGQGGLHGFSGWSGPWLTDSGGFQVTSLADRVRIDEQGVRFQSPVDGRTRVLTPERVVEIQESLGSDIAMVLDECRPPAPEDVVSGAAPGVAVRVAMERTLRWAERSLAARTRRDQWLFGIVQGGVSEALRRQSARATAALGFDGHAHGGLGLGEERERRTALIAAAHAELPEAAPRYLMGLGRPSDLVDGIAAGIDLFDCVLPTRHGRHGALFTSRGLLRIRNARFRDDPRPPDPECSCPTCARHSRAYLHHLLRVGEALGARLASLHNLGFYLGLMGRARAAIAAGTFASLRAEVLALEAPAADAPEAGP
jgi:queuine tRNA-ribosyltransferase